MRSWVAVLGCALAGCVGLPEDHRGRDAAARAAGRLERALQVDDFAAAEAARLPRLRDAAGVLGGRETARLPRAHATAQELLAAEADAAAALPAAGTAVLAKEPARARRAAATLARPGAPVAGDLRPDVLARRLRDLVAGLPQRLGLDRPILPAAGDPQRDTGERPPRRRATLLERLAERLLR
jgi:hypothetical protein